MKKSHFLLIVLLVIILTAIALRLADDEDVWLCRNGQWVQHGQPMTSLPTEQCITNNQKPIVPSSQIIDNSPEMVPATIILNTPQAGTSVTSPLLIKGQAPGTWFFEASLPIKLLTADQQLIVAHYGLAEADWMTTELVPFTAILEFQTMATSGFLVIAKDNPSGLSENDAEISWPLFFQVSN